MTTSLRRNTPLQQGPISQTGVPGPSTRRRARTSAASQPREPGTLPGSLDGPREVASLPVDNVRGDGPVSSRLPPWPTAETPLDIRRPFTRADALAAGIIPKLLRGSRFRRLFPGVYISAEVPITIAASGCPSCARCSSSRDTRACRAGSPTSGGCTFRRGPDRGGHNASREVMGPPILPGRGHSVAHEPIWPPPQRR